MMVTYLKFLNSKPDAWVRMPRRLLPFATQLQSQASFPALSMEKTMETTIMGYIGAIYIGGNIQNNGK